MVREVCYSAGTVRVTSAFVQRSHRLLSVGSPQTLIVAVGICTLSMRIGRKEFRYYMSVVPKLSHSVYVGADILVHLGAKVDRIHQVLWSQASIESGSLTETPKNMRSGQTIPQACQTASEFDVAIPARMAGVSFRLMILKGQELQCSQAFFQLAPYFFELSQSVKEPYLLWYGR